MMSKLQAERTQVLLAAQGKLAAGARNGVLVVYNSII